MQLREEETGMRRCASGCTPANPQTLGPPFPGGEKPHRRSAPFSQVGRRHAHAAPGALFSRLGAAARLQPRLAEPGHDAKLASGHGSLGARMGTVPRVRFSGRRLLFRLGSAAASHSRD